MAELGLGHKHQVQKLINAGLIGLVGKLGRTQLLDPADVAALKQAPYIATPTSGHLVGIVVSTDGLAPDTKPENGRPYSGWLHPRVTTRPAMTEHDRLKAFTAWWNTGMKLADQLVGLPLLQSTSGFIGEVQLIETHYGNPVRPDRWFITVPAPEELASRYLGHRLKFPGGAPWIKLFRS